jgi:hypothetical protein|nr:MAG TPA: hypothetical protein [Caudoviricetes sp.]
MGDISLLNKIKDFKSPWCYQYQRRLDTLEEDKEILGWTDEDIKNINLEEFEFSFIVTKEEKKEATEFIKRYEWLGTVGSYPTHWFAARYKGILGGVIIMGMPNSFSKLLGEKTKDIERLIARGASASWTPMNLGSKFLMWCIKWMIKNTQYRLFTCYSDLQAKENGSIYQALNFYFLGAGSGTNVRCVNPYNPNKIMTDRAFRSKSFYKRYAKDLGIEWQKNWSNKQRMLWENIPDDIEKELREYSKKMFAESEKIYFPSKYKYAFILGKDKRETKLLRNEFINKNKVYEYPKRKY